MSDPLANVPDPDKRFQAFGVVRKGVPFVEVVDVETKQGFILDIVSALQLAGDINHQLIAIIHQMVERGDIEGIDSSAIDETDESWMRAMWRQSPN